MKRFTYLLSALFIILLSANASPVKSLKANKKADVFEQVKHVKATHAHALPAMSLQKANVAATQLRAPQAKKDADPIEIVDYAETYYATDNDVWVKLYDADENIYYFDIVVAEGTKELALNQTYTLADMIPNYSYMRDADYNKTPYASASLTKTVTMYEEQELRSSIHRHAG